MRRVLKEVLYCTADPLVKYSNDKSIVMVQKCRECGADLPDEAKFCLNCGTQMGMKKEVHQVSAEGLVGKVKEIVKDANVKRIVVKDDKGKVLLSIPVTWGAAGAVVTLAFAPWLAALGVIAGIVTRCTIEVEKTA